MKRGSLWRCLNRWAFEYFDQTGRAGPAHVPYQLSYFGSDAWSSGVIRKKEDHVLTGRQPWELRSCELVFASAEVLHSVAAGPPTQ